MQTATSETESKSLDLSICVHHYTLRAPCPKGQGIAHPSSVVHFRDEHVDHFPDEDPRMCDADHMGRTTRFALSTWRVTLGVPSMA